MNDDAYVLPSSEAESDRLERQAELYGGIEFLMPFLAQRPTEVLDVGCGTGHFTRRVAKLLAQSSVSGMDMDDTRIEFARLRNSAPNINYAVGDLASMPFEDGRFDLVFCRFVLVHAADPTNAIKEMVRVTRPGGQVVAYDMVHDGIWFSPEKPAFARLLSTTIKAMRERHMEPSQGLHLAPALIRAGLEQVEVRAIPHSALATDPIYESYRENWTETVSGLAEILGDQFDGALIEQAREELEQKGSDQLLLELTVLAHGRKSNAVGS